MAVAALRRSVPKEAALLLEKRDAIHVVKLERLMRAAQSAGQNAAQSTERSTLQSAQSLDRELRDGEAAGAAMAEFEAAVDAYMPGAV